MENLTIRNAVPADYSPIITVLNEWWGGRSMSDMLPRLFFIHFHDTCFVTEHEGRIKGFLVGFLSQTFPDQAYIHFAGIHPEYRRCGLGSNLYNHFFSVATTNARTAVKCVTSPVNKASIAFHLRLGFHMEPGDSVRDGISVFSEYDGPGGDRVLFSRNLDI